MFSQTRELLLFLLLLYFVPLLFLCAVVVTSLQIGIPVFMFMRDPASIAQIHPFIGVASNFGVILWTASATICLFSWAILRHRLGKQGFSIFILVSGLITTLLLLDDFFLLHDFIFPSYFGVKEFIFFIAHGGLILCWIVTFRKYILKTEYLILLIALGFFGLSLFIDIFQHHIQLVIGDWRILFEDGFKLLGIVGWLGYFLRCCFIATNK